MTDDDVPGRWPAFSELHLAVRERLAAAAQPDEGLREWKKRLMRQQISDTATALFFERGFDDVRVSEVATACGVSEKTVYNYFPTKESLLLDREEGMADDIRRALGPGAAQISPVEATVGILNNELAQLVSDWEETGQQEMSGFRRFIDLLEHTPSLRAAQFDMMERLAQVAARAMAARAAVNPDDPEPQIAAEALLGLWRVYFRALPRYSDGTRTPSEVRDAVLAEVRRAARLIDTGLWSFGMAVQGASGRQQLRAAAEASNEARKQVVVAINQAREAWRIIKAEVQHHAHEERESHHRDRGPQDELRQAARQVKRGAQEARRDAQQLKRDAQQLKRDAQNAAQLARRRAQQAARRDP